MCSMDQLFKVFSASFTEKTKCEGCLNDCLAFCPDSCLDYADNRIPNYSCSFLRDAYVLRYFATHKAELLKLYTANSEEIMAHISMKNRSEPIASLSLGAGPGTDLIAFAEWLWYAESAIERPLSIEFLRVDINDGWNSQCQKVKEVYKNLLDSLEASFKDTEQISDAFNIKNMPEIIHMASASYLLSELSSPSGMQDGERQISKLCESFKNHASNKSVILINDRPEGQVRELAMQLSTSINAEYPKSHFKEFCFDPNFSKDHGITIRSDYWCGHSLPKELRDKFKSKTRCTSYQCIIFIDKSQRRAI